MDNSVESSIAWVGSERKSISVDCRYDSICFIGLLLYKHSVIALHGSFQEADQMTHL